MDIGKLVRENIEKLKPYTSARESHLPQDESIILLDANENAYGSVVNDNGLMLNRYPDPYHRTIKERLSEYINVNPQNLFIGVGSDEIIDLTIRIFCTPGKDKAMILEPTYGMYEVACNINDVEVVKVELNKKFQIDFNAVKNSFDEKIKIIFLCSPNNPTGNLIEQSSILRLAKEFPAIIVVDQAYYDFAEEEIDLVKTIDLKNIILLRTFSKAWGLAGIRCGYCIAQPEIINYLYKIKLPYNLNKLTSAKVIEALENIGEKEKLKNKIISERKYLIDELDKIRGIKKVYPSDSNFILFEVEEPKIIYERLAAKGIIIRDRSNQVKGCLRVTVGTEKENKKFIDELKKIL
ncbi:histidinol-phosphate transaminase [Melioribacteraceae bacterium 4301-Me]|uniref:histidinol-phosphate transaminase n=1 Tax=Pyranulibacter aquaticus TaxID=3163344 RepID=UPI003597BE3F